MKFEHFALNVPDARAMAEWYVNELGLRIAAEKEGPPFVAFLADDTGRVIMEIYTNTSVVMPDYSRIPASSFHVAFVSDDPPMTQSRLEIAGASALSAEVLRDGSTVVTLRDPWGVPIQFCKRSHPF
jgi:catechol 2,3-dioxygenase-like lactoylglutathione lyase family enzyme